MVNGTLSRAGAAARSYNLWTSNVLRWLDQPV
jgi:hypothetical protein